MSRLLQAITFAAQKHSQQRRKNSAATPYINHPIEVAEHLFRVGGITDEDVLIAAVLHDTIEDTDTTYEEVKEIFGLRIADIVMECTDDKSLVQAERKRLQIVHAPHKSPEAKCVKLADKTNNLNSLLIDPPLSWSLERQKAYVDWAEQVVAGLLGINQQLDEQALEVIARGKAAYQNI